MMIEMEMITADDVIIFCNRHRHFDKTAVALGGGLVGGVFHVEQLQVLMQAGVDAATAAVSCRVLVIGPVRDRGNDLVT